MSWTANAINTHYHTGRINSEEERFIRGHQKRLDTVLRNAQNLLVLVNQILDFRKLEMKKKVSIQNMA